MVEVCGHMGLLGIRHLETLQCRAADVVLAMGGVLSENYSELCRSLLTLVWERGYAHSASSAESLGTKLRWAGNEADTREEATGL